MNFRKSFSSITALAVTVAFSLSLGFSQPTLPPSETTKCPKDLVCYTVEEAAEIRYAQEDQKLTIADLEYEVAKYKSLLGRSGKVFAEVGMEYALNTNEYIPYFIGGYSLGRTRFWGGTFGDDPVVGIGWSF